VRRPGPVALLDDVPLTENEAGYVEAARAANIMRGYRSDWREYTSWCAERAVEPMPAAPATVTDYLSDLARCRKARPYRRCRRAEPGWFRVAIGRGCSSRRRRCCVGIAT
jgi:hypothetical protein